jgi:hypothetical protein
MRDVRDVGDVDAEGRAAAGTEGRRERRWHVTAAVTSVRPKSDTCQNQISQNDIFPNRMSQKCN